MSKFFTSDFHLEHKNIMMFQPASRKGDNLEQMKDMIFTNISEQMKPGDDLYNLGDFSFGTFEQIENALITINKMRINHHFVFGNHDRRIMESPQLQCYFSSVSGEKTITVDKKVIIMSHFKKAVWDRAHYGSIHLHGHGHADYQPIFDRAIDVGIDTRAAGDMKMYPIEDVMRIASYSTVKTKHH